MIPLNLYLTSIPCGFPSPGDDYIEKTINIEQTLVKNPSSTFCIRADGESMEPTIFSKNILIVDKSIEVQDGMIVLACIDGEFTVKRFFNSNHRCELRADNPKFSHISVHEEQDFSIFGVITSVIREV